MGNGRSRESSRRMNRNSGGGGNNGGSNNNGDIERLAELLFLRQELERR